MIFAILGNLYYLQPCHLFHSGTSDRGRLFLIKGGSCSMYICYSAFVSSNVLKLGVLSSPSDD